MDDTQQAELQRALGRIQATLEGLSDRVDMQGSALAEVEARVTANEQKRDVEAASNARDRLWIKWIFVMMLALVGDHFTGSKISDWISAALR
jgi:hypothetical protein